MPLYEYQCSACGHEDTMLEKHTAARVKKCPSCGKLRAFKRLVSAAGFQLKGKGWYQTDFRDSGKPPAAAKPASKAKESAPDAGKEKKADAKGTDSKSTGADAKGGKEGAKERARAA